MELKITLFVFLLLFLLTGINLQISLRKGRDSLRKNDISALQKSLDRYQKKYASSPISTEDGKVIGCFDGEVEIDPQTNKPVNAKICSWGESFFEDSVIMPRDPNANKGTAYYYTSDGDHYGIYVALEGKAEAEYSEETFSKNLHCGNKVCNYGRSY